MKLYIIVRTDKEYSIGKLLVHSAHICEQIALKYKDDERYQKWYIEDQFTKIIVKGRNLEHLLSLIKLANEKKLINWLVRDAGFYETKKNELLMVAILATEEESEVMGLKKLNLFRG